MKLDISFVYSELPLNQKLEHATSSISQSSKLALYIKKGRTVHPLYANQNPSQQRI